MPVFLNQSKKVKIDLSDERIWAFDTSKNNLLLEDVVLNYPDFREPFDLMTDASSYATGAVLYKDGKSIRIISRTLIVAEENYANNKANS